MPRLLQRYATPAITGLFLVSLISGIALFVGVGQGLFHEMHEILSVALVVPFALHVWKNWRSLTNYLGRAPMTVALALSAAVAVAFAFAGASEGQAGGPPQFAFASEVLTHTVAEVAPVVDATPDELVARLTEAGFAVTGPEQTLSDIAAASGEDQFALVAALMPAAG
ncbi:hypothetical protein Rumeso_03544 [Rubellimicrobium mesophilum DSM 19309]|uniref:DUF4405 domain-containing protein n=1 Tax=Rubellimicrobium mesophilum DSM 19309 TaxID=442562 RepID=A0A017HL45_9RHOB|nr:DUF4405 domain-containing protein [Rubellimicrobium mesophilum]EYD74903.1 hypothetical protein Rumeso_03544 [Rubellimicrobium mesophilum DSM 19309]